MFGYQQGEAEKSKPPRSSLSNYLYLVMTTMDTEKAEKMISQRLTPYSINSAAKVEFAIMGQSHWFDGLRIAENIICEKQEALEHQKISATEQEAKIRYQESHLKEYSELEQISIFAEVQRWKLDLAKQKRLIEDAQVELDTALKVKARILTDNPEIADLTYQEIQLSSSYEAYYDARARQIALALIVSKYSLDPEIVKTLLSFDAQGLNRIAQLIPQKLELIERDIPVLTAICAALQGHQEDSSPWNDVILENREAVKLEKMLKG